MFTQAAILGFVANNFDKISAIAKSVYGSVDETMQIALRTAYTEYLTNTSQKYSKSKSFFIRDQPTNLYDYYVPIGIKSRRTVIHNPMLSECLGHSSRIVISGSGGSGKSVLMKHLFLDCIDSDDYAPVMIELRDLNEDDRSLDVFISDTLDSFGFKITGDYIQKAKKSGHFCFFLDGYDEVNYSRRKKLIKEIRSLADKFPACPIFMSSRPDESFEGLDSFSVFRVTPLSAQSAKTLIEKLPFDEEIKTKFLVQLKNNLFDQHQSFLSNPLLLSIMLLTYGENSEIPTKLSIFYNQAFEALFRRHDSYKGGFVRSRMTTLDSQDFARVFSLFSLQTYERREFKMSRNLCLEYIETSRKVLGKDFVPENYLQDLLSAACLLMEEGLDVAYSHRSFQEYFTALHMSTASPVVQEKLVERFWRKMRSDDVIWLLYEINPDLVERLLILPKLDSLFSGLNVGRSVGITHTVKFIKKHFKQINVSETQLSMVHSSKEADESDIANLAVQMSGAYIYPSEDFFKEEDYKLWLAHVVDGGEIFEISRLGLRHPLLLDIVRGEGRFSLNYMKALYQVYKNLKAKHSKSVESLNILLGI